MAKARLAVDIGGTFTDVALQHNDALFTLKTPTTPEAPADGVMMGMRETLDRAGLSASDIGVIIHGTTLATNALIERRGAVTALLTTEGHRDSLEMAYENRFEQYDLNLDRPKPLVPRWLRLPIRERINWHGDVLTPLEEASIKEALKVIDGEGVESVAIGFLHAYANPSHEERTADIIRAHRPDLAITLASACAPVIREYERQSTAVANAYVQPLIAKYLQSLSAQIRNAGATCPFLLMTSGGGLTTVEDASRFPIRLVESGPAGGAILAAAIARDVGDASILSFDMGGTTAKLCMIDGGEPTVAQNFEVDRQYKFKKGSGLPVLIPVIDMVEIGAGGGSIARVDALNRITVGPESAGADPGPAGYGHGGRDATVTDADAVSGKISAKRFGDGSVQFDLSASQAAVVENVAKPLSLNSKDAAYAITEVVDEAMAAAARAHALEQGRDPSARVMVAFGGAAPLHAARLSQKLGIKNVIVPANAGVGSAIGFLIAPAATHIARSAPTLLSEFDPQATIAMLNEMFAEAEAIVSGAAKDQGFSRRIEAQMRFKGQGSEVSVPIAENAVKDVEALSEAFLQKYKALYGRAPEQQQIEIVTWTVSVSGPESPLPRGAVAGMALGAASNTIESRVAINPSTGDEIEFSVIERSRLSLGSTIEGPAFIAEAQTTTVVPPSATAEIIDGGAILLTLGSAQ